ncbi:MAG: hypothetical protein KJ906_03370 [Nanoarchaeota archaeon]|nr:hypothetical protein [Nanoarchaeota archaeon]
MSNQRQLIKKANRFIKKVNSGLPGIIKLEYRGTYKKGLFVADKDGKGTKKKYALIDKNDKLLIRGFETQRGDWCNLVKVMQEKILRHILLGENEKSIKVVKQTIKKVKDSKFKIDDVIINVQLTKPIEEYKMKSAHVEVAKKLNAKEGTLIQYVITNGKGSFSERAQPVKNIKIKNIDKEYYINKQILPSAMRVLKIFGIKESDMMVA